MFYSKGLVNAYFLHISPIVLSILKNNLAVSYSFFKWLGTCFVNMNIPSPFLILSPLLSVL